MKSPIRSATNFRTVVMLILIVTSVAMSGVAVCLNGDWPGLLLSIGTNLGSTALTYYLIDRLIGAREKRESEAQEQDKLKRKLMTTISSNNNGVAIAAVEELRQHGWLYDGSLKDIDLLGADLQGANLAKADLRGANLSDANLEEARLTLASLQGVQLQGANLHRTDLIGANLHGASLVSSNLRYADLREATLQKTELYLADLTHAQMSSSDLTRSNLSGACLYGTNLNGATLYHAILDDVLCDESTVLPDGTKWKPNRELQYFTRKELPSN